MSVVFFDSHVEFWTHEKIDLERGGGMRGEPLWRLRNWPSRDSRPQGEAMVGAWHRGLAGMVLALPSRQGISALP